MSQLERAHQLELTFLPVHILQFSAKETLFGCHCPQHECGGNDNASHKGKNPSNGKTDIRWCDTLGACSFPGVHAHHEQIDIYFL